MSRHLLQNTDENDAESTFVSLNVSKVIRFRLVDVGFECSLRNRQINEYLDEGTRTWLIDDSALDELESDLQSIVNCTQEGDVILFDVSGRIRLASRVTIPWRLTLSSDIYGLDAADEVVPRASRRATFNCPRRTEGVFYVRYSQVSCRAVAD